jgi:tRNA/tmRNA/rRNA uracil-C5-methylase (TrmA/RlmC/RlmD family)
LTRRLQISLARDFERKPPCKLAAICPGCALQGISREGQARLIRDLLAETFGSEPESIWQGPEEGWLARPRLAARKVKDMVYIGWPSARGQVFDLWDCPNLPSEQRALLERIKRFFKEESLSFYDPKVNRGKVMGLAFYGSPQPHSLVVSLITRLPVRSRLLGEKIARLSPDITGVAEECEGNARGLFGEHHIFQRIAGAVYRMTPGGSWPRNPFLHQALVEAAGGIIIPGSSVAEAGAGYFLSLALSSRLGKVLAFDVRPELLSDMIASAEASFAGNVSVTLDNLRDMDKKGVNVFLVNADRGPIFAESARDMKDAEQVLLFGSDLKALAVSHRNLTRSGFRMRRLLGFEPSPNRGEALGLAEYGR